MEKLYVFDDDDIVYFTTESTVFSRRISTGRSDLESTLRLILLAAKEVQEIPFSQWSIQIIDSVFVNDSEELEKYLALPGWLNQLEKEDVTTADLGLTAYAHSNSPTE